MMPRAGTVDIWRFRRGKECHLFPFLYLKEGKVSLVWLEHCTRSLSKASELWQKGQGGC